MISMFQKRNLAWIYAGAGLAAVAGCGDAFNENCAQSRSCAPQTSVDNQGGAGGDASEPNGKAGEGDVELPNGGVGATSPGGSGGSGAVAGTGGSDGSGENEDTGPHVVSITPDDGADDQALDVTVVVAFNEPLDPATVTDKTFRLLDGDSELKGDLQLNAKHDRLTFKPEQPLDLFATYHVEISSDVTNTAGDKLANGFKSSFQARDGVWSVTTLDQGASIVLPNSLPAAANGSVLATWLTGVADETTCTAGAAWALRGQTKPSEVLERTASEGACLAVSAGVAPDGGAVTIWKAKGEWLQAFQHAAWSSAARDLPDGGHNISDLQAWAHDGGQTSFFFRSGPALWLTVRDDEWAALRSDGTIDNFPTHVQMAFDGDGDGFATWTGTFQGLSHVRALPYDATAGTWGTLATCEEAAGTTTNHAGPPSIALGTKGEAMTLWVANDETSRSLKSSHLAAGGEWEEAVTVTADLYPEPLFDPPALAFDGETFVSAWTAKSDGHYVAYTARYDLEHGEWSEPDEPHIVPQGDSAVFMPRLGADSHHNLILVWAVAGSPFRLAYQRYRAETGEWGKAAIISGSSFTDATFETDGKLPFSFSGNGIGGLMFRHIAGATSTTLKLAQFY